MKKIYGHMIMLSLASLLLLQGCRDDVFDFEPAGDGTATVRAVVDFTPLAGALGDTRASGDAIRDIHTLSVVIYDAYDRLVRLERISAGEHGLTIDRNGNTAMPSDEPDADQSEAATARATFSLSDLPYGRYRIYAVANMELTEEDVRTPADLRSIRVEWNRKDVTKNDRMFGYFTLTGDDNETSRGFEAPLIVVKNPDTQLHAWIRRLASKLTIAFDASGVHNGVEVFIHKVTVRDIADGCILGEENKASVDNVIDNPSADDSSQTLFYTSGGISDPGKDPGDKYSSWLRLIRSSPLAGDHSENSQALYFFENCQGNFENKKEYDKQQDPAAVGRPVNPGDIDYKDNVPAGTYVEVEGYYKANVVETGYVSEGRIKYRFMLGQDTRYDYNVIRNQHYKLTMKFRGYANQIDWHIDYDEQPPTLFVPQVIYVPYLYNHRSMLSVRAFGNIEKLQADIIENGWYPCNYDQETGTVTLAKEVGNSSSDPDNRFLWNRAAYNKFNGTTALKEKYACLGFLSLSAPSGTEDPPANIIDDYSFNDGEDAIDALREYYQGKGHGNTKPQHTRQYVDMTPGTKSTGFNAYTVSKSPDNVGEATIVRIPLITRPKSMIFGSGFSGNNPYDQFRRYAKVRITATFNYNGKTVTKQQDVDVVQVRRIVNPKAVWRSSTDNDPFRAVLTHLPATGQDFVAFNSEGEWKAYVQDGKSKGFVSIDGGTRMKGDTIFGDMGTPVDFNIRFNGVGSGESECAIINVEYHGFTCVHKIFVRQGYDRPMKLPAVNGAQWSSFNLYSANADLGTSGNTIVNAVISKNPLAIGTLFKRGNYRQGILIKNNNTYGPLTSVQNKNLKLSSSNDAKWTEIDYKHRTNGDTWRWAKFRATFGGKNRIYRVPTYDDFKKLDQCNFGFGVLYADGATTTQMTRAKAYGFQDDNNNIVTSELGVRGCVVYDRNSASQIFFPLGKRGMGRRVSGFSGSLANNGYLRYGDVAEPLYTASNSNNIFRPVPYDLPAAPGAIYWTQQINWTGHVEGNKNYPCAGWDINYFAFDFNPYTANNVWNGNVGTDRYSSDALPVKLVYERDE